MEGRVKIGPWGGRGGRPRDIASSGSGVAPHLLESVVIRAEGAVDAISFTYAGADGKSHKAGPWGGSGGRKHTIKFGGTEVVTKVCGTYGPFGDYACIVRSLTFVTNVGKHGPFGRPGEGTPFSVPVHDGGRVVGFFGRSGGLQDAVGVNLHPACNSGRCITDVEQQSRSSSVVSTSIRKIMDIGETVLASLLMSSGAVRVNC